MRWTEVTESGFEGGVVMPDTYDGSPASLELLRHNLMRSGQVGRLVSNDMRSSIVEAPIFDKDPITGKQLDYHAFSQELETRIRDRFQDDTVQDPHRRLRQDHRRPARRGDGDLRVRA